MLFYFVLINHKAHKSWSFVLIKAVSNILLYVLILSRILPNTHIKIAAAILGDSQ